MPSRLFIIPAVTDPQPNAQFCSLESLEAQEALLGTAPRADVWFLLEYRGRWGNKALPESTIPDAVKAHLNAQASAIPEARLLLIKQPGKSGPGLSFFAAVGTGGPPALYRFELGSYEDLLAFDLSEIAARHERFAGALTIQPLFAVCTNGLRDQCCALHGLAASRALAHEYPGLIWESTHHGGHRFAANILHLPHGLSYGRARSDSAIEIVQSALDRKLSLDYLRGRSTFDEPAQAAEGWLRREYGLHGLNGLAHLASQQLGEAEWSVRFRGEEDYTVIVGRRPTGVHVHVSCGDEKTSPVVAYHLVDIKIG